MDNYIILLTNTVKELQNENPDLKKSEILLILIKLGLVVDGYYSIKEISHILDLSSNTIWVDCRNGVKKITL